MYAHTEYTSFVRSRSVFVVVVGRVARIQEYVAGERAVRSFVIFLATGA